MNVRDDIRLHAADEDKPILNWLFGRYHMASEWRFVAKCTWTQHGPLSYQSFRVWTPTTEGRAIYAQLS
jgi:hypothetical protein